MNQSEAGPEIATGLTKSDLKCASQFFRDAAQLDTRLSKKLAASLEGQCKMTEDLRFREEFNESSPSSTEEFGTPPPPREERSAPEGTSSPDPRSLEGSDIKGLISPGSILRSSEVNELLKKQERKFEEKLLRQSLMAADKEDKMQNSFQGDLEETKAALKEAISSRDALLKLVEQYKGMLSSLVSAKEKQHRDQKDGIKTVEADKNQALEDLANVEAAFSDVHRKYERTKQIVDTLRRNEETLRNAVADYEAKLLKQEKRITDLQKQAEEKIRMAGEEFESLRRSNDQEMIKMGALLKKAEMKIISLQEGLDRKSCENQELTQLCDDLISKVGS